MDELGLLEALLTLPHQKAEQLRGQVGEFSAHIADFRSLSPRWGFIALMPQWDFLDFLADHERRFETFDLRMHADVTGLTEQDGIVRGVHAETPDGPVTIRAAGRADFYTAPGDQTRPGRDKTDAAAAGNEITWEISASAPDTRADRRNRISAGACEDDRNGRALRRSPAAMAGFSSWRR